MKMAKYYQLLLRGILYCSFLILASPILGLAGEEARPFWTEKSAYIEGHDLYAVGVASGMATSEEGRLSAFEHGKIELMNFAQVTDLEAEGLTIETQMTFEENNDDGTINVFRLLRVDGKKLLEVQGRLQVESQAQKESLDKVRQELEAFQQSIIGKQQEFETQVNLLQASLSRMSNLETNLTARAQSIDQRHREVERLIATIQQRTQQMEQQQEKVQQLLRQVNAKAQTHDTSMAMLERVEVELDAKSQEIARRYEKILARIKEDSQKACQYVTPGMTPSDVRALLGDPKGEKFRGFDEHDVWSYGTTSINFDAQAVVSSVGGCR